MKDKYVIDEIDKKILSILRSNARMQWREIGDQIHLTGQAVGERVKKMTKHGIIKGYYADIALDESEEMTTSFITVIMTSNNHQGFLETCNNTNIVTHVYRTSGNGCYLLRTDTDDKLALNNLLEKILIFGNYQVSTVIQHHK